MLRADELVLQFRHLLFRAVEHTAQLVPETQIDIRPAYPRQFLQRAAQPLPQALRLHSHLLEQRPGNPFGLIEEREQEMFICDLLLPGLRRDVLCGLDRLLHFLREFVDAHGATYETPISPQSGACFHVPGANRRADPECSEDRPS